MISHLLSNDKFFCISAIEGHMQDRKLVMQSSWETSEIDWNWSEVLLVQLFAYKHTACSLAYIICIDPQLLLKAWADNMSYMENDIFKDNIFIGNNLFKLLINSTYNYNLCTPT